MQYQHASRFPEPLNLRFPSIQDRRAETRQEWHTEHVGTERHSIGGCKVAADRLSEHTLWVSGYAATIPIERIFLITGVETLAEITVRWYCLVVNVH